MEYIVEGRKFSISYSEIREHYLIFCDKSNEDFLKELPAALHLACVICFLKEIPTYVCLSDKGIVHELVHLLHIPNEIMVDISEIRILFKEQLRLS